MKVPKITIDKAALKKGFWGNTWKNWGYILLAFLILYAIEAGYFTGLLFASKRIRQQSYRTLPTQYFGEFERDNLPLVYPYPEADQEVPFNRPKDCSDVTETVQIPLINEETQVPTGVQKCIGSKKVLSWVLFPWVADTQAAGTFPGCANADGATLLTQETSPAYISDSNTVAPPSEACQNFVINKDRPDLRPVDEGNATSAPAPAPAPARAPLP